jgi:acyl-coenzyme A thioesterase PaaI-like protein
MTHAHFGDLIGLAHLPAPEDHALIEIAVVPALCNRQGMVHGGAPFNAPRRHGVAQCAVPARRQMA